jgi:hypothetical protein
MPNYVGDYPETAWLPSSLPGLENGDRAASPASIVDRAGLGVVTGTSPCRVGSPNR